MPLCALYTVLYPLKARARTHTNTRSSSRTHTHTLSLSLLSPPTFHCFWKPLYQKAQPWTIIGNPISVDKCIILCWISASFPLWSVFTLNFRVHITNECPFLMFSLNMMYRNCLAFPSTSHVHYFWCPLVAVKPSEFESLLDVLWCGIVGRNC